MKNNIKIQTKVRHPVEQRWEYNTILILQSNFVTMKSKIKKDSKKKSY